jgi:putative colanic acid biosynthesis UDP-glucose lipid carrier transferase
MYEDTRHARRFFSAPPSGTALVAALGEPALTVLAYVVVARLFGAPLAGPDLALCLLAFALGFPAPNRYWERAAAAAADIGVSWAVLLAVLMVCGHLTDSLGVFDARVLLAWAVAAPALHWAAYFAGRTTVRRLAAQPASRRAAVIVGAGPLGLRVAQALESRRPFGHDFLGFFEDRLDARAPATAAGPRLGGFADLAAYVRRHGVHEVYLTLPLGSQPRLVALLDALQDTTASLYFVPDVFGISVIQGRLHDLEGVPVVGLCETPFTGTHRLAKRACDLLLASLILLLIAPLLAAIAVGVKLSSPGPVIFRQRRNGLDGSEIVVYKFRSMRVLDDGPVVAQATRGDPRITPFGAFLRRTSLDELPQFINVLQGRMSIVGPRPHAVAHNDLYRTLIKAYTVRHKVKPGITGWAQVNGCRGETDTLDKMRARIEYDLEYLRNWSLALDLQIVARTVRLMFFDRHAY